MQMRRKASPSPKANAYFSLSDSEESHGSSLRGASLALSPTPDRSRFTKPPRATPDHRRGLRSPNPSPLSPRGRPNPSSRGGSGDGGAGLPALAMERHPANGGAVGRADDEDANDGPKRPEISDRWAPEEDGGYTYGMSNGNASASVSKRERSPAGRDEDGADGRQKRYKEAHGSRHGGRDADRRAPDRKREVVPREERREADRDTHYRYAEPVPRHREANRVSYGRGGEHRARDIAEGEDGRGKSSGNGVAAVRSNENGRDAGDGEPKHENARTRQQDRSNAVTAEMDEAPSQAKVERQRKALPPGKSGGVYIPPFKLAQMMRDVDDKSSHEYQRLTWDALRKSINGLVNKVNASNLKNILPELFSENLIRGRGLFARSCMKSQMASPGFTHIFAALVAVVNTKFPELGELLLKRIILQLRRAFRRNDKPVLLAAAKFIAHLVNQQVAHEILALELLTVLLESPTDDSVEVAVGFVRECGAVLQNLSPQGLHGIFERFRGILHEGEIDKRVQFMIEGVYALRKAQFQGFPGVLPELDLVDAEDQITHDLDLNDEFDGESYLDIFRPDPEFAENEKKYENIKKEILGDDAEEDGAEDAENGSSSSEEEEEEDEDEMEQRMQIQDETETNLVNLRRTIYLTIMSSVDFEESGHKLLKIKLEAGQEMELCVMLLECCSQERTYLRYYGLLGQRFCLINRVYQENFDQCFVSQYSQIHRLETNKLRNVAKFFAHLLGTDALPWQCLAYIRLTEEDTTSSSRIFIKILFQELAEHLGLRRLNERLSDPMMQESFDGIFPKDNPKNTRFAINFFTSIGLGGLTDSLRDHLKNMPRLIMQQAPEASENDEAEPSSVSETSSGSESVTDSESEDSSSEESDSSRDDRRRRKTSQQSKKK